jgi:hypothetical protein
MPTPLQQFYYLITQLGWNDRVLELLKPYGVTSIKNLSPILQEELVDKLNTEWKNRSKRPRGAVIHYLCIMPGYNFKNAAGDPNYEKIDDFVKALGSNNPNEKELNKLTLGELNKVVSQVKAMYARQLKTESTSRNGSN